MTGSELSFNVLEKDGKKEMSDAYTDEQITTTVDSVLGMMDKDKDGFISYSEFMKSEQAEKPKKAEPTKV